MIVYITDAQSHYRKMVHNDVFEHIECLNHVYKIVLFLQLIYRTDPITFPKKPINILSPLHGHIFNTLTGLNLQKKIFNQ